MMTALLTTTWITMERESETIVVEMIRWCC